MYKIDLHMHSNISNDGEYTTEQIVKMALDLGMSTIAITDHNSSRGVQRAIDASQDSNLKVISGIEIDCTYKGINLHLLGYYIDHNSKIFKELEENIYKQEMNAFEEKILKMENLGFVVNKEEILLHAGDLAPSGELIGEIILNNSLNKNSPLLVPYFEGGERSDMPLLNFYWDFFAQGKLAYVPINYSTFEEAIDMISSAGGIAVVAHPGNNFKNSLDVFERLLNEKLVSGIEVFSNYHSLEQVKYFYDIAVKNDLQITCGSDFHGKIKPLINLGEFGETEGFEEILKGLNLNNTK